MNKKAISSEIIYVLAIVILAFAVNLMSMANLGMSMIVCPAYIISEKFDFLTYGQAEYLNCNHGVYYFLFSNEKI